MKRKIILGLVALLIIASIIITGCTQKVETLSDPTSPFDIYYSFGVGEKNILDTKNDIYTKDLICAPSKAYDFKLTNSEKTEIHNSILQNDLFNIKDNFTENCDGSGLCQGVEPLSTETLIITTNEKNKTMRYSSNYIFREDSDLQKFQNVINVIRDIISQKEKAMNIERPLCGYE